jgi:hypothetical protein
VEYLDVGHVVQFYSRDDELADYVADYLLRALNADGAAVVIASAAHRRAFEARLTQAGADLATAAQSGGYLALDANETLDALMPRGELDPDRFESVITGPIVRAGHSGSRMGAVRAYGEMVALLWEAGLVDAAVRLEEMWESLVSRLPFSVLCSYPADSMTGDGYLDAFAEVCRLHRSVAGPRADGLVAGPGPNGPVAGPGPGGPVAGLGPGGPVAGLGPGGPVAGLGPCGAAGPAPGGSVAGLGPRGSVPGPRPGGAVVGAPGVSRAFAFSRDAPAAARHFAVDAVRRLGAADLADDTALVVTELAANAIVHAQSGFTVDIRPGQGTLRISVSDAGPVPHGAAGARLPAVPLHGLGAVDSLARRWGVEPQGRTGKSVWVELAR